MFHEISSFRFALSSTVAALAVASALGSPPAHAGGPGAATAGQAEPNPITIHTQKTTAAGRQQQAAVLLQKAQNAGRVRVIIGLDINLQDEDALSPAQEQAQVQALESVQTTVARRSAIAASQIVKFSSIPFMSAFVTRTQLQRLLDDPQVVSIQEDTPILRPLLADSTKVIRATTVWNTKGYTGQGVTVAVIDTGAEFPHPMIKNSKVVSGFCRSTNTTNVESVCPGGVTSSSQKASGKNCDTSISGCNHGTHVSGIAVGKGGGLRGVAPDATLISGQAGSKFNLQADCGLAPAPCVRFFFTDITAALERVFQLRNTYNIASVNMSLGGGLYSAACDAEVPALTDIINKLTKNSVRIAVVIASGNDGSNTGIGIPACIDKAVAVGSTTKADDISSFSNHHALVDVMAPGSSIQSSVPGGGFAFFSGTSMASPHVAGAWALMRQARPAANVNQVQNVFKATGVDVTRNAVTKPRIDAYRGVNRLENLLPTAVMVEN